MEVATATAYTYTLRQSPAKTTRHTAHIQEAT